MSYVVCAGLATQDSIFEVPHHPEEDGRVVGTDFAVGGGGPAATAAVTLARLGVEVFFVGVVGDDEVGAEVRDGLEREGVDVSDLKVVPGAQSPQSVILVNRRSASRTIVHYPGTTPPLALDKTAREQCLGAAWVHVDHVGYGALRRLRHDVRLSVDGGNPIDDLQLDGVALYAPTDPSLREDFGGRPENVLAAGAEIVVVTRADAGSLAMSRDGETIESPGLRIEPVSTLGAGDVFRGALVAQLVRDVPLRSALVFANACAALSCRALDGRSAIPSAPEVAAMVP
jgi:sugar/nucleoside kinase (ribokinase family)